MAFMRSRSQLNVSAPPPSPIPTGAGSRSAANGVLAEFIDKTLYVPDLTLPESQNTATGIQHPIPEEVSFRSLESSRPDSIDKLMRSAREFGAFRLSYHGISNDELRSLVREAGRVLGVLEERDTGSGRNYGGNRDEIVWAPSCRQNMEWAREYVGPERYRCFSQEMDSVANKLDAIAGKLGKIITENRSKKSRKINYKGESILSVYRYNHNHVMEQSPPLPEKNSTESHDFSLSLHLPAKNCEFLLQSDEGPLSFHADPDAILVTFGKQLEEWSQGEFRCVPGEIIYQPDAYGSRTSFSVELKCSSLNGIHSFNTTPRKTFTISDQIIIGIILIFTYKVLMFLFSR